MAKIQPPTAPPGSGGSVSPTTTTPNTQQDLPLDSRIGQPMGRPGALPSIGGWKSTPPTQQNLEKGISEVLYRVTIGQEQSPFATERIKQDLRMLTSVPEAAYVLTHPDIIESWQTSVWTNTLLAMGDSFGDSVQSEHAKQLSADFFDGFSETFSAEERDYLSVVLAAMPNGKEALDADGFEYTKPTGSLWNQLGANVKNVWGVLTRPETIRPVLNDPRSQLLALATDYLQNQPLNTLEDREKFITWFTRKAQMNIDEFESTKSGFFAVAQATVGWVPDSFLNQTNDWLQRAASPSQYSTRRHLSWGQNFANAIGISANERSFNSVSGATDGFFQVFGDPQNLIFGAANAIKNAARIPRLAGMSRGQAMRAALNPFSGRTGRLASSKLPVFDRSLTSRLVYAAFSKDVDTITNTAQANRMWTWISGTSSASDIVRRFPGLEQSDEVVTALAQAGSVDEVREVVRAAMHGGTTLGTDTPLLKAKRTAALSSALDRYKNARATAIAGEKALPLGALDQVIDEVAEGDVYVIANAVNQDTVDFMAGMGDRLTREGAELIGAVDDDVLGALKVYRTPDGVATLRNADDEIIGVATDSNLAILDETNRGRGLGRKFGMELPAEQQQSLLNAPMSGSARAAAAKAGENVNQIYSRTGKLTQDGQRKVIISQFGGGFNRIDIADPSQQQKLVDWLIGVDTEDAIELATRLSVDPNTKLSDLSRTAQDLVMRFTDSQGAHVIDMGGEMMATRAGRQFLVEGVDSADDGRRSLDVLRDQIQAVQRAKVEAAQAAGEGPARTWFIQDLPSITWTRRARLATSSRGTSGFMQQLRRAGFRMTHQLPTNIPLHRTGEGATGLSNWIKALGGTDELASEFADKFRAGTVATRRDIIHEAMVAVGNQIENPHLKHSLIQFSEKQGHYTYMFNRAGAEIGLSPDGHIRPMTVSHFTDYYAMPDPRQVLRTIKRYRSASKMKSNTLRRGLKMTGTQQRREAIVARLKNQLRKNGVDPSQWPADEELLSMAYADVLGEGTRATGLGAISKATSMVGTAYQGFHHVFVIAQLAFRPIAWASRVLLEETVRADLMSMPSLWSNPIDYIARYAEARAIRKLPDTMAAQAKVLDGLITDMFADGVNLSRIEEFIPDIAQRLEDAGIPARNTAQVRALVVDQLGRELTGITEPTIGLRGNITQRAMLRQRKLGRTRRMMERNGLGFDFRWDADEGARIANRSYYVNYVTEAESATVPLEFALQGMTDKGLRTYGRGYGRQMHQMIHDPIVGVYGLNRAIDTATGRASRYTGAKLSRSAQWEQVRHIVDDRLAAEGLTGLSEAEKAQWYLDNVVDEIVHTLFDPLAQGDPAEKARILRELKNGGSTTVNIGGAEITLNAARDNYEGFVRQGGELASQAYYSNVMLPQKISAFLDPRFGQEQTQNVFRRFTDMMMMTFGENATQRLNRQPAYVATRKKYYQYYIGMGWDPDTARMAAAEKAAELVNYVYFDNSSIPQFLKDMNDIVPFFSAMYEVASTWLYKIPSVNVLPIGYAQLTRRIQRVLKGLQATGIVRVDPESGRMIVSLDHDMENANDPVSRMLGRTLYQAMRLPLTTVEHLGGLANLIRDGEYEAADLEALSKGIFEFDIGNPLDPRTSGLMAVNQFSIGPSPVLALPTSIAANAVFSMSNDTLDTSGMTVGDFVEQQATADEPISIGEVLRYNQQAFLEVNSAEAFNRALNGDMSINDLIMPDAIRIPGTSVWETLVDNVVFPFGQTHSFGEVLTSVSPAALNYVWRGLFQRLQSGDETEWLGMFFGQYSNYQVASEILSQLQIIEATDGSISRASELAAEIQADVERLELQLAEDPEGNAYILDPDSEEAAAVQEKMDELHALNAATLKRANDNAGGALIFRGIAGSLGPVTPRMVTQEQQRMADFWTSKEFAVEAEATGEAPAFVEALKGRKINGFEDIQSISELTNAWLEDSSGDAAKVWLARQSPALLAHTQGKTYWGPAGPPPAAAGFDKWVEQLEAGDREAFPPEVFMARYQRAAVAIDREIDIIDKYGNDPDEAAVKILEDYDSYKNLVDPYDYRYDGLDFIDHYLYEGKYSEWRDGTLDDLSVYELMEERIRRTQDEVDNLQALLDYASLTPDEHRRIRGVLNSTIASQQDLLRQQRDLEESDETWMNPRETVLNRYYDQVSNPYYEGRNELFDMLDEVETSTERSILFDAVRMYDNEAYLRGHIIEGWDGEPLSVPDPLTRTWNGRTQEERQERILSLIGKKPDWLNLFEVSTIVNESPQAAKALPTNTQQTEIYDEVARRKYEIVEMARRNPDVISGSQRDKALKELDEELERWLIDNGRGEEVLYRNAVPIQKLAYLGLLPESLREVSELTASIVSQLREQGKSPTTEQGRRAFLWLQEYLETDFFTRYPQAAADFDRLGVTMFDEKLRSGVYAKLLQGDFFGELR